MKKLISSLILASTFIGTQAQAVASDAELLKVVQSAGEKVQLFGHLDSPSTQIGYYRAIQLTVRFSLDDGGKVRTMRVVSSNVDDVRIGENFVQSLTAEFNTAGLQGATGSYELPVTFVSNGKDFRIGRI